MASKAEYESTQSNTHELFILAIASGANVKVVQQMLGHKSATMTRDLYGHLFADQLDEVADALDRAVQDHEVNSLSFARLRGS